MATKPFCDNCAEEIKHRALDEVSGTVQINGNSVNISLGIDGADLCLECVWEKVREMVEGKS